MDGSLVEYVSGVSAPVLNSPLTLHLESSAIGPTQPTPPPGVGSSLATSPNDSSIVAAIQDVLWQNSTLKQRDIRVSSLNGVVSLAGTVASDGEKQTAENLATRVPGVSQVINHLLVSAQKPRLGNLVYTITNSGNFGTTDLATGAYTNSGNTGVLLGGLGVVGGRLYGGAIRTGTLYNINPLNGTATPVGTSSISYFLTGSTTSGLYAVGQDLNLYAVNPNDASVTLIGPTSLTPAQAGGATLSSGGGTFYMAAGSNYNATLYTVNVATGTAKPIGSIGQGTGAPALVFVDGALYAGFNYPQRICTISTTTATPTCSAKASGLPGYFSGMAPIH
jgi:hypothetical protein